MVKEATFKVDISVEDCKRFAEISGDWNPLHTDIAYAKESVYERQVLHGAFSAGLISKLAGMHLPGRDCLLFGMKLRFVNPILPPETVIVKGKLVAFSNDVGKVEVNVSNLNTGMLYVDASYEFGMHRMSEKLSHPIDENIALLNDDSGIYLVTGTGGGLGSAVMNYLGKKAVAVKRDSESGRITLNEVKRAHLAASSSKIAGIIHCAWPKPDNRRFIDIENVSQSVEQQIAGPVKDIQVLSSYLAKAGIENAPLILVGSTFANAGRHYYRMPLYSIAKNAIPAIVNVLSLELSSSMKRCFGIVFDVLDGGMNKGISDATRMSNADRSPWGELGTPDDAAKQVLWLLENQSKLLNGSVITLTGGSIP